MNVNPRKVRLHIEEVGDAEVVDAFIDPRSKRWAYRVRLLGGDGDKDESRSRTRIIYPDQIATLEWSVRGEMELLDHSAGDDKSQSTRSPATPLLLGGGDLSLGSRIVETVSSCGNNMSLHTHPFCEG